MGGAALNPSIEVWSASRPFSGEDRNGDAWACWETPSGIRVAVIDGLGHGPRAAAAAAELERLLVEAADCGLEQLVERAAQRSRGSRGAVAMLVEVRERELSFVGVGNVEGRLLQAGREQRLLGARGFFGGPVGRARPQVLPLEPDWTLYLYTDGVSSRFPLAGPEDGREPQDVVDAILEGYGRATDDATVVMVRRRAVDPGEVARAQATD